MVTWPRNQESRHSRGEERLRVRQSQKRGNKAKRENTSKKWHGWNGRHETIKREDGQDGRHGQERIRKLYGMFEFLHSLEPNETLCVRQCMTVLVWGTPVWGALASENDRKFVPLIAAGRRKNLMCTVFLWPPKVVALTTVLFRLWP